MADQEDAAGGSTADEYEAFHNELIEDLRQSRQGYDRTLPLREALGAAWDIRIQVAYLPSPRDSVTWVDEFYLVGLVREGEIHFAKRCDTPWDVAEIVDEIAFGSLAEEVSAPEDARLHRPYGANREPWQWMKSENQVPFLTPLFAHAYATREQMEQEHRENREHRQVRPKPMV